MDLHLLLAPADGSPPKGHAPARLEAMGDAPLPAARPPPTHLLSTAVEPDSLPRQRWALVIPQGDEGKRLRAILEPLVQLRQEQQQARVDVFEVSPQMDAAEARKFRYKCMQPPGKSPREYARYVVLAGGPDVVPLALQDELAGDATSFVGRIAFDSEAGYEAYVSKLVAHEKRAPSARQGRLVIAGVNDGTPATEVGIESLIEPIARLCEEDRAVGHLRVSHQVAPEVVPKGDADRLKALAAMREPGVFFTLSHGTGAPQRGGWRSVEAQRRGQGCLSLAPGVALGVEDVASGAFVPGGVWFYFACFGAGTPLQSVYWPWMEHLRSAGHGFESSLASTVASRPLDGKPFIGPLPQAALANPDGPIAVIAHLDLAWAYSFLDAEGRSHPQRFVQALVALAEGHRAGVALDALTRSAVQVDGAIRRKDQDEAQARVAGLVPISNPAERAYLLMERNDLASYVLLGDPAARLSLENGAPR